VTDRDACQLAASPGYYTLADILDVDVVYSRHESIQEDNRILTSNKVVAGVHVHPQEGRVRKGQHLSHAIRFGGEIA